jgi:nucleoside-diphosphate kinase
LAKPIKDYLMFLPNKSINWIIIAGIVGVVAIGSLWFLKCKFCRGSKIERTLAIIKPDAVIAGNSGKIIDKIEQAGFKIIAMKKVDLTKEAAEDYYSVHKEKPFFNDLVQYISSGSIVALVLEKENGVQAWRDLMGETDPQKAKEGTLRKLFGTDLSKNALHGSDSEENATIEIGKLFSVLK